jgi:long-chain fatty acid transport protein
MARRVTAFLRIVVLCLAAGPAARAQTNDEVITGTQFDFSTPGARSLGLGGAFLAVADDATAAFTNPAGLTQLARPEVSLEGRTWGYTSRFTARGHAPETALSGIGVDVVDGLESDEIDQRTSGLSFLSAVWTTRRASFAVYRHQLADFRAAIATQGAFVGPRVAPNRISPARAELEMEIENLGLSAAVRLHDTFSLGLGVSHFAFSLGSTTLRYATVERTGDPYVDSLTGHIFGPADFRPGNVASLQEQQGDDSDWEWSLGALWRPSAHWSFGAVWRRGPAFDFEATFTDGPANPNPGEVDPELSGPSRFHVPDAYGLGVAWRPLDAMVVSCDWMRVEYSQMTSELRNVLRASGSDPANFSAPDVDELHLGAEYQFLSTRWPVAVRAGLFFDPEHRIRYTGESDSLRARFRPGEDQTHYAFGAGVVIGRVQIDAAADLSQSVDTVSLSMVARF